MGRMATAMTVVLGAAAGTAASDVASFGLPEELSRYREWSSPTKEPVAVPLRLWGQCAPVLPEQRAGRCASTARTPSG